MSDYELILVAGLLLAAGLLAAKAADRVRVPGLLLFLGLGMLLGSEGPGGIDFDNYELARTLGTIGLILILFEGGLTAGWGEIQPVLGTAISLATIGTVVTAADHRLRRRLALRPLDARGAAHRRRRRRDRQRRDLCRPARLAPAQAPGARAGGRIRDERSGRAAPGHRVHQLDPGPRTTALADMVGSARRQARDRRRLGIAIGFGARWCFRNLDLPNPGLYPVASIATVALAYGVPELAHGSGFLSVYITALILGTGPVPASRP